MIQTGGKAVVTLIELYMLAEIVWYTTHDGETLHKAIVRWGETAYVGVRSLREIRHTYNMIRKLPES